MYLVDTDVLGMLRRSRSAGTLPPWLAQQLHQGLVISAATVLEIEQGASWVGQRHPHKEVEIRAWLFQVRTAHNTTILPIGPEEAILWGRMRVTPGLRGFVEGTGTGRARPPRSEADLVIAATAITTGRQIVTRNLSHMTLIDRFFHLPGIIDPWGHRLDPAAAPLMQMILDL
jgi:predicted nucleic acid-binding protein